MTYTIGDRAYIVENKLRVREVLVLSVSGDLCTLRFTDGGGGLRLRASRLFPSQSAAEATLPKPKKPEAPPEPEKSAPPWYMH